MKLNFLYFLSLYQRKKAKNKYGKYLPFYSHPAPYPYQKKRALTSYPLSLTRTLTPNPNLSYPVYPLYPFLPYP